MMRVIHIAVAAVLIGAAGAAGSAPIEFTGQLCTADRLGASIDPAQIGEPVSAVTLDEPVWKESAGGTPAYCMVTGSMAPIDRSATARPIHFGIALPAAWNRIGVQVGGGGMNGVVPQLTGGGADRDGPSLLGQGIATYGSDSGHSIGDDQWALNDEAIRNLGFMQMKKTHDAALVILQRAYGVKPSYSYYVGTSQGGREALTVVQRYPADYDGVAANVPIVNFSGLMLAPVWTRVQEKPIANWVPPRKSRAIVAEFMRQCDGLDGLVDGVIRNYVACRALFNDDGRPAANHAWDAKRCPGDRDPAPEDDSAHACLTDAQIGTLKLLFSSYHYRQPLANGNARFGMWAPTTDMVGSPGPPGMPPGVRFGGLLTDTRFRGQEGAAADAPVFNWLGAPGLAGFVLRNLAANPLDYTEGASAVARRREISGWLDSTGADLSAFRKRGGKLLVVIGTDDTVASPGAQLDYYQSVIDKMGRTVIDGFARLYVLPQTGHGLSGASYTMDGNGQTIPARELPNHFDRLALLRAWVENGDAPGRQLTVTGHSGSQPMCSYPQYPRYAAGSIDVAGSYVCTNPGTGH